jgi:hypothetical protein
LIGGTRRPSADAAESAGDGESCSAHDFIGWCGLTATELHELTSAEGNPFTMGKDNRISHPFIRSRGQHRVFCIAGEKIAPSFDYAKKWCDVVVAPTGRKVFIILSMY